MSGWFQPTLNEYNLNGSQVKENIDDPLFKNNGYLDSVQDIEEYKPVLIKPLPISGNKNDSTSGNRNVPSE